MCAAALYTLFTLPINWYAGKVLIVMNPALSGLLPRSLCHSLLPRVRAGFDASSV
jgi:hypothetical protein